MTAGADRLSAERDYRRIAHQAVTEGVNLKYVEQMRQALYAAADELDAVRAELAQARKERDEWKARHGMLKVMYGKCSDERRGAEAALAAARDALEQERDKWSFDTLLFVAEQLLAQVYPPDVFPRDKPLTEGEPGPRLVRALHLALEDCRRAGGGGDPA